MTRENREKKIAIDACALKNVIDPQPHISFSFLSLSFSRRAITTNSIINNNNCFRSMSNKQRLHLHNILPIGY